MSIFEDINYDDISIKVTTKDGYGENNTYFNESVILCPMYKKIKIDENADTCDVFPYNDFRLELYCPECKCRRIFCFQNSSFVKISWAPNGNRYCEKVGDFLFRTDYFSIKAKADCKHNLLVMFKKINNSTIMKVGQFPSIYDMNEEINNKKFLKVLGDEYCNYYKNACSLYSYNTCIGAMVYLRRIFEKVILETFENHEKELDITLLEYKKLRMDEKLEKIKKYLPNILFEQGFNSIYSKVSDGVHNLSEDECQSMFPILKSAIEEILIDKLELQDKEKRRKEISNKINNM